MNEEKIITDKGKIAAHFHEAHPLALADLLLETDYLSQMETREIIGLLSVFIQYMTSLLSSGAGP